MSDASPPAAPPRAPWWKQILTADDNQTFVPDKVALIAGILVYFALAIWDVVVIKTPFLPNAMAFGTGLGAVLGAGAGGSWLMSRQKSTSGG